MRPIARPIRSIRSITWLTIFATSLGALTAPFARASTLESAEVTEVLNDVRLKVDSEKAKASGADANLDPAPPSGGVASSNSPSIRSATIGDKVQGNRVLYTGRKSRAELRFNDKSVARLGANSIFSFKPGSRDVNLSSGFLLLHTPPGQGGAKISTPSASASILGTTVMLSALPGGGMKMLVVEGTAKLEAGGKTVKLEAGQMSFIMPGGEVSQPITVNLQRLVTSSGLFTGFKGAIGSEKKIQQAIQNQAEALADGELANTGVSLHGDGSLNALNDSALQAALDELQNTAPELFGGFPTGPAPAITLTPAHSIDFGSNQSPPAIFDEFGNLIGTGGRLNGEVFFKVDTLKWVDGPTSQSNLAGVTGVSILATGQSLPPDVYGESIIFQGFQPGESGFGRDFPLNLIASRGSARIDNSVLSPQGGFSLTAAGYDNSGGILVRNSDVSTAGGDMLMTTPGGKIELRNANLETKTGFQVETIQAMQTAAAGHIALVAPAQQQWIHLIDSTVRTIPGGTISLLTHPGSGQIDLLRSSLIAPVGANPSNILLVGNQITLTDVRLQASEIHLGNAAESAVINFVGNNNVVYGNLVVQGKLNGTPNVQPIASAPTP